MCSSIAKTLYKFGSIIFASTFSLCVLAQTSCPNPGVCFLTQQAKDKWAAENNCVFGAPPQSSAKDCSEKWRGDEKFLNLNEGQEILNGYVPIYDSDIKDKNGKVIHKKGDPLENSGVTVGTGVDLGQHTSRETKAVINRYIAQFGNAEKVDVDALIKTLSPYFSPLKGKAAQDALTKTPLVVSLADAKLISRAFQFETQNEVAAQFDENNTQGMVFKQLPKEAQTVIIDFAYQYGLSDEKGAIRARFWGYVYSGKWQDLANWLNSGPDIFKTRRKREGKLLRQGIDSGQLPAIGNPCGKQ